MHPDKKSEELEQVKALEQELRYEHEKEIEIEAEEEEMGAIGKEIESSVVLEKKKRREALFEMSLFFILGLLLGVAIKTEAIKRITIGFNDYQISKSAQNYDVSELKKNIDEQAAKQQAEQQAAQQQGIQSPQ